MICHAKNRRGKPCRAPAIKGSKRCVMQSGRAAEIGSKGGRRRATFSPDKLEQLPAPKDLAGLKDLLGQSLVELRAGRMDPKLANSISYLAASFVRTLEGAQMETGQASSPNANAFQIYEAMWLRDKKARWAKELEAKYAHEFPVSKPPGAA